MGYYLLIWEDGKMNITDIRIVPVEGQQFLKAYVSVTFDDELVVHNIRIIHVEEKLMISMPNKKLPGGEYRDYVHPITQTFRKKLTDDIIAKYHKLVGQADAVLQEG